MKNYLVVIKESFVRDAQVAPDEYIKASLNDSLADNDIDWSNAEGELVIGMYQGNTTDEALEEASKGYNIDIDALNAYELAK